ncbi:MAG: molybdate ABC transporter substrate-binding protein [Pirellulaceae bacterium]|nr:molybdate ABC transporter substrate-binding protein [Pirellulaceae bacterium]
MKNPAWILLASLLLAGAGIVGLSWRDRPRVDSAASRPLVLYCAAANRVAVQEIIQRYQEECGRPIQIEFGPSQTLLSRLEVGGKADLYLPSDDSYLELAAQKDMIAERIPIATMQAVLVVPRDNPKSITSLNDLLSGQLRIVQADPDATAIGKVTQQALAEQGLWQQLHEATTGYRGTVVDVATDVQLNAADVGIVYDVVLANYPELRAVFIPELAQATSQIDVAVLQQSSSPRAALHFARYLAAKDRGLEHFAKYGYQVQPGDQWADQPELSLYAGSMLRPAIADAIERFQEREGVQVSTVYNGCGILVGQMKAGQVPDAYFACDVEFMNQVTDLFPEPVEVSQNELVIVVPKGNPQKIGSLRDLTRPGLRVGIGHEKQCAMGWITQNTFREGGIQQEVMKNVTVEVPAGDMLVNQMRAGSLDAAVVYLSNAAGAGDILDAVQIQGLPCSVASQPWAVYKDSRFPHTASRLFQAITSQQSQTDFESEGFRWQLK